MIVKNSTKITKDEAISELTRMARKDYFSRYFLSAICFICGIFLLIIGLSNKDNQTSIFSYVFIAIGVAYTILTTVQYVKAPAKVLKDNEEAMKDGIEFEFIFKEQSVSIQIKQGEKKSKTDYSYYDFKKISETESSYEFRVDQSVIIANKSGFESKRMEQFFVNNVKKNKKVKLKLLKNKKSK